MDEIYKMKLHETITPQGQDTKILRVSGGWIYTLYQLEQNQGQDGQWTENYKMSSVFVPFDNEFQS